MQGGVSFNSKVLGVYAYRQSYTQTGQDKDEYVLGRGKKRVTDITIRILEPEH
jgi:hypothetical protein